MSREEMSILWAGGWDDFEVDIDDQIDDPDTGGTDPYIYPPEMKIGGNCADPQYIRTTFSAKMRQRFPGKAIRVLGHTGGGD